VFGWTYRVAWTWHFEAERVVGPLASQLVGLHGSEPHNSAISEAGPRHDKLRVAMAAVDEQERAA
jgi:hypothetical protein